MCLKFATTVQTCRCRSILVVSNNATQEDIFFYLTVMNENTSMPAYPADSEAGILRGLYRFRAGEEGALAELVGEQMGWLHDFVRRRLGQHLRAQDESVDFFATVKQGLDELGIAYHENPRLVRGLDYYTHTAFEFTTNELGAQGAVLAGGRYDGLVETMGGPPTPGTGWAAGIERLALMLSEAPAAPRPIAVVPVGKDCEAAALRVAQALRRDGFTVELGFTGNVGKRMKRANKLNACAAVLLGEDELARNAVTLRDLDSGEQELVALDALSEGLARFR